MIEAPVRGSKEQPDSVTGTKGPIVLYRLLDETLIEVAPEKSLGMLLESEPTPTRIKHIWIMGKFSSDETRATVVECLKAHKADWVEGIKESSGGHFNENGVFLPSPQLIKLVDNRLETVGGWLMIWPWYCSLSKAAERDILTDLGRMDCNSYGETLLRKPVTGNSMGSEPASVWSGKTLLILPGGDRRGDYAYPADDKSAGSRAGWALDCQSASDSYLYSIAGPGPAYKENAPEFHFGVCLRSRQCTHDWSLVCQNLERTLFNLSRQRCRNFKVWIAIHEQPDIDTHGLDVEFVVVNFKPPVRSDGTFGNDKARKRNAIGRALSSHIQNGFYYMQLDADDLIDTSLVQAVYDDDNRAGYLIENGYIFDYDSGIAARCHQESVPFWKQCGSCAVLYFKPEDLKKNESGKGYFESQHRHEFFSDNARAHGRELTSWADDMALYLVNHGENHWSSYRHDTNERRGNSKSRFVYRHQMHASDMHALFLRYPELDGESIDNKEAKLIQGAHQ